MEKKFLHQELEVAQAGGNVKEGTRKSRVAGFFTVTFFSFSILLSVAAVAFAVMFVIHEVVGASMMLTLNAYHATNPEYKDIVLTNRFLEPKTGNIIVVRYPWPEGTSGYGQEPGRFIKRAIGLAGDRIRFERTCTLCDNGPCVAGHNFVSHPLNASTPFRYKLYRNDLPVDEHYLDSVHWGIMAFQGDNIYEYMNGRPRPHQTHGDYVPFRDRIVNGQKIVRPNPTKDPASPHFGKMEIVVPEGEIFYLGDNRGSATWSDYIAAHSYDGTAFGPQQANLVTGIRVATIEHGKPIPEFIWEQIVKFFSFKWLF